jgi:hypothetical protein
MWGPCVPVDCSAYTNNGQRLRIRRAWDHGIRADKPSNGRVVLSRPIAHQTDSRIALLSREGIVRRHRAAARGNEREARLGSSRGAAGRAGAARLVAVQVPDGHSLIHPHSQLAGGERVNGLPCTELSPPTHRDRGTGING